MISTTILYNTKNMFKANVDLWYEYIVTKNVFNYNRCINADKK